MYHIAIIEDDEDYRKLIRTYLTQYGKEKVTDFKITEFENAITFLTGYKSVYDAVFIDIQMPYMDGMEAAAKLREIDSSVILVFITNMSNYAVKGYSVNATDFIVKPVQYGNFTAMLSKVIRLIESNAEAILINSTSGKLKIKLDSILYVEVVGHQIKYHTDNGEYIVWETLKEQERRLPADRFIKCNNYCLVNLKHIDGVIDGNVKIQDYVIPISRSKKKDFNNKLLFFYGKYI